MIAGKPLALARDASDLVGECYELIGRRAELASPSITGRTDAYQDLLLKVTPPRLPRNLVPRKRLTTTAHALGDASVLLVQAPAGFGKTSLLAQWRKEIQSTGVAVAWLSAHTRDDPHRLVQALTLAVRVASGKAAFGQAAFEFDGDDRLEHVTVFLAELAQSAQELVLIVDEADKLPEASREALNYLLRQAPQNLPPRQNSCRLHRTPQGAAMKDGIGSIRTGIHGQGGGEVAAAGERTAGSGVAGNGRRRGCAGAVARQGAVHARPRAGMDCRRPA